MGDERYRVDEVPEAWVPRERISMETELSMRDKEDAD
jgi:hypothetical protein